MEASRLSRIKKVEISKEDTVLVFESIVEAEKYIGCSHGAVSMVLGNKISSIYGWNAIYK